MQMFKKFWKSNFCGPWENISTVLQPLWNEHFIYHNPNYKKEKNTADHFHLYCTHGPG